MIDLVSHDEAFDPVFKFVRELEPFRGKELDPVVVIGIVGSGDHDAGIGPKAPGKMGNAGSCEGPDKDHIDSHGG